MSYRSGSMTDRKVAEATSKLADIEGRQWEVITALEKAQERQTAVMDVMVSRLEQIEKKLGEVAKPQWQAISVLMGVVFFVYGIISFGINQKIDSVYETARNTQQTLAQHMQDGHPASVIALVNANKDALQAQLRNQEREMDHLDHLLTQEQDALSAGTYTKDLQAQLNLIGKRIDALEAIHLKDTDHP